MGYTVPGIIIAVGVLLPFAWFDNALDAWLSQQIWNLKWFTFNRYTGRFIICTYSTFYGHWT